jgi:hypothetical protein
MTNIALAILSKYPNAIPSKDFIIRSNEEGQYIAEWNLDDSMPTNEELESWYFDFLYEAKREEMSRACNEAILENFFSPATGFTFEFKEYDQSNFTQQMLLLIANPSITEVQWKTVDAGIVTLTREQFFAVVEDANIHKRNALSKFWAKEAELKTFTTTEQIQKMEWNETEEPVVEEPVTETTEPTPP